MTQEPVIQYTTTSDGVRIAYYSMGSGIPFVACSELLWSHLKSKLPFREYYRSKSGGGIGRGMRVVRYDARGTGFSDQGAIDFSLAAQERDLEAVLHATGIDRFALFARYAGSYLAIRYAATHPERVSHLVLTTPAAAGRDVRPLEANFGATVIRDMTAAQWKAYTQTHASGMLDFGQIDFAKSVARIYEESMSPEAFWAFRDWRNEVDVTEYLPLISVPTLVLHRRTTKRVMTELDVAASIPNCRLVSNVAGNPIGVWLDAETEAVERFLGIAPESDERPASEPESRVLLTPREQEVLVLLVDGRSNREIAEMLSLGERTVARHIANIYDRTGVHGRAEITAYAVRHRLV